jgi:hypothetical protein
MFYKILAIVSSIAAAEVFTISNTECRSDINNNLMDTHDGNIVQWTENGLFWFYSMGY